MPQKSWRPVIDAPVGRGSVRAEVSASSAAQTELRPTGGRRSIYVGKACTLLLPKEQAASQHRGDHADKISEQTGRDRVTCLGNTD
jgi:hypothetical protein